MPDVHSYCLGNQLQVLGDLEDPLPWTEDPGWRAAQLACSPSSSEQLTVQPTQSEFSRSLADISLLSPEFMGKAVGFLKNEGWEPEPFSCIRGKGNHKRDWRVWGHEVMGIGFELHK